MIDADRDAINQFIGRLTIMTGIKIFQLLQTFYQNLGLYSPQTHQSYSSKFRIRFFLTCIVFGLTSMLIYVFIVAETMQVISFFSLLHLIKCKKNSNCFKGIWNVHLFNVRICGFFSLCHNNCPKDVTNFKINPKF